MQFTMKFKGLLGLCLLLVFVKSAFTSHFRGGYITWKPNPDVANQIIVTWRLSWKGSGTSTNCDSKVISSRGPIGDTGNNLRCDPQCTPSATDVQVICNDFNLQKDWSSGVKTANFHLDSLKSTISYSSGDWISLLNSGGSWNLAAHVDLSRRSDNNKINTSPQTMEPPIIYTQQGCPITITVPVVDPDGDDVRCRWADGESGGVTRPSPDILTNLDEENCRITVVHNADAYIAIALAIEDFIPPYTSSSQALSTVPLQFLVKVNSINPPVPCSQRPVFVIPTPEDNTVYDVIVGTALELTIRARGSDPSLPVTAFTTISPQGMTRSDITNGGSNEQFISIRWNTTRTSNHTNYMELFCFSADDSRQSSEQRCVTLNVIQDIEAPEIVNIPASENVYTDSSLATATVWWTPPTASDNSGEPVTLTSSYNPGDNFTIGKTSVTYTATDVYGNMATYSFDVIVTDVEPPVIVNYPSSRHVNTDPNSAIAAVWWPTPTTRDNSGESVTLTSDYKPGDNFTVGNTTVTYTAVDVNGNTATYSFYVVVTVRKQHNTALWMIASPSAALLISFIIILVVVLFYRLKNSDTDSEETGYGLRPIRSTGTTMFTRPNEYHYQQNRPRLQPEYQDLKTERPESCNYDDVPIEESLYQNFEMSNHENDNQNDEEHYYDLSESEQGNNFSRQMGNRGFAAFDDGELFQNVKF